MIKKLVTACISLLCITTITACNNGFKKDKTTGVEYAIYTTGTGNAIQQGDFVKINMIGKCQTTNGKDSVILDTYNTEAVSIIVIEPTFKGDLMAGFTLLKQGDSAAFKVPLDSMVKYYINETPSYIQPQSDLTYTIKVEEVKTAAMLNNEAKAEVQHYVDTCKIIYKETGSGLRYSILQDENTTSFIKLGDTLTLHYTGKYLNGETFLSTVINNDPAHLIMEDQMPIKGLKEALSMLKQGDKGTFIFTPDLAFGATGMDIVPPYTPVIFAIQVLNVRPYSLTTPAAF